MDMKHLLIALGIGMVAAAVPFAAVAAAAPAAGALPTATAVAGKPTLLIGNYDLDALGYVAQEYFIDGTATSYASDAPLTADGNWTARAAGTAAYRTRLVVIRPKDAKRASGTVLVEWLNVSGGIDAPAEWLMAHREIMRSGMTFVAVSAQKVGIDGGRSLGGDMSLKKTNPERYGSLVHPGDAFAFDIFSQTGRLVRANSGGLIGPARAKHVIAAGESQSASFLTTYVNAIDPLAKVYDGFFIHSRFAGSAPLDGASMLAPGAASPMPVSVRFRAEPRVPVMTVIAETDLVGGMRPGYHLSRQPASRTLRVWEIPGTAHADIYTVQANYIDDGRQPPEKLAAAMAPSTSLLGTTLSGPFNFAPQHHYVVQAALNRLDAWVRTGRAPAPTPLIDLAGGNPPAVAADAHGMATGGIRTPWIDVPVARNTGVSRGGSVFAALFGSGDPFTAEQVAKLYPGGKADYLRKFTARLDAAIADGTILAADRAEILAVAAVAYPG